jgi:2-polyprenyl-6-methoxyphenol hydroxylase-like FAD-dependent oxidoreductase
MSNFRRRNGHPTGSGMSERHAVVLGAGIAGLLSARILADHYEAVTLIERDVLPAGPQRRRGVPQAAHVHGLLLRGRQIIESLLPGVTDDLIQAGAVTFDFGTDLAIQNPYGWNTRAASGLEAISASRELTEWAIRRRLTALPRLTVLDGTTAHGLLSEDHNITAVRIFDAANWTSRVLPADLVVDATGRGSRTDQWLAELGYPPATRHTVEPQLHYASRTFRAPPGHTGPWRACLIQAARPGPTRGATLLPIEDNRWLITLIGLGADRPSARDEDFLSYAESLRSPVIADAIAAAEALTPVVTSHTGSSSRRLLRRHDRHPDNFVHVGDSAYAFNPLYAQGMTTAALAAQLLGQCLSRTPGRQSVAANYHRHLHRLNAGAWTIATLNDLRYTRPDATRSSAFHHLIGGYLDHVLAAATQDPMVHNAFLRVFTMMRPPSSLMRPAIATRVLKYWNSPCTEP